MARMHNRVFFRRSICCGAVNVMNEIKRRENYFESEIIEAPEVDRRKLMDASEAFIELLRTKHPERSVGVETTPGTERARMMQSESHIRTRGWVFE
jgi:hypothetical protein